MYSIKDVTGPNRDVSFCLTDCGPSDGCSPDDRCSPDDKDIKKNRRKNKR